MRRHDPKEKGHMASEAEEYAKSLDGNPKRKALRQYLRAALPYLGWLVLIALAVWSIA